MKHKIGFTIEEQRQAERYATRFGLHSCKLIMTRPKGVRKDYLIGFDEDDIEYRIRIEKVKAMKRFVGRHQVVDPVDYFIKRAVKVHGDKYDYSHVTKEDMDSKPASRGKVAILCNQKNHGIFYQDKGNHINHGKGCPKCAKSRVKQMQNF